MAWVSLVFISLVSAGVWRLEMNFIASVGGAVSLGRTGFIIPLPVVALGIPFLPSE